MQLAGGPVEIAVYEEPPIVGAAEVDAKFNSIWAAEIAASRPAADTQEIAK